MKFYLIPNSVITQSLGHLPIFLLPFRFLCKLFICVTLKYCNELLFHLSISLLLNPLSFPYTSGLTIICTRSGTIVLFQLLPVNVTSHCMVTYAPSARQTYMSTYQCLAYNTEKPETITMLCNRGLRKLNVGCQDIGTYGA